MLILYTSEKKTRLILNRLNILAYFSFTALKIKVFETSLFRIELTEMR